MKNTIYFFALLFFVQLTTAQNKDKVKGSKVVRIENKAVKALTNLDIEDNFTVNLIKANQSSIDIEADDNLHEYIIVETFGDKVRIFSTKRITSYKALTVNIKYTDSLKSITARHKAVINAFSELSLENLTINNFDYSESFLNVKAYNFRISINDKSSVEMNVKSDETTILIKGDGKLKALTSGKKVEISMYDEASATIEGDAKVATIQLTGKAKLTAKNSIYKELNLTAKNDTQSSVYSNDVFNLEAFNAAEVHLYGSPKINIIEFKDRSSLHKEEK